MSNGIPPQHHHFWQQKLIHSLYAVYLALLDLIEEPILTHPNEGRVFGYLKEYVGNLKADKVQKLLRFITESSVFSSSKITVSFNALSGLAL